MKIAIVRQRYNPFGGAERFVERASAALIAQGASLQIIAREWSGKSGSGKSGSDAGGDAPWLRCDPFYVGRTWRDAAFARAVCGLARGGRFDLVQSHERIACCDVYRAGDGVHAQWLDNRARTSGILRNALTACHPYHRYVLAAERRTFASPRLRAVICNSRMVRDEIRRRFNVDESKLHVIYNGVDLDYFNPSLRIEHRRALRAKLVIPEAAPTVLFVGSGFERKGLPQLLRAMVRLPPDTRLLVVGRDGAQRGLERLARSLGLGERVRWAGGQQDVRPWYGAADLFALPTLYDPFPNAALEALASGLPLVTSRSCGAAEIVEDGVSGHVCRDALDVDELAAALARTIRASGAMSAAARAAAEPFAIAAMAASLLELYRSLLEHSGA
jgi:UDP-glucose:(heptosyl)LPS alpha-1,3-glucosyltransferase